MTASADSSFPTKGLSTDHTFFVFSFIFSLLWESVQKKYNNEDFFYFLQ